MLFKNVSPVRKLSVILAVACVLLFIGHKLELYLPDLESWIAQLGAFAPLGFIALFVALTPVFVSVDALCFAAGLLFSLGVGELTVISGTYLASALIFFLGRYLIKEKIVAFIAQHPQLAALDATISNQPFKLMFLLRLTPLPFALLCYALAVTEVEFRPYLGATSGILIYNCTLVYLGYTTKHLAALVSGTEQQGGISYPLLALGLAITLAVLFYVTKIAGETITRLNSEKPDLS